MDEFDLKIIKELQQNGRISNQELSERINLSPSPCLRRVRLLEETGVIAGYTAIIDQKKIGNHVSLYVRTKIARHSSDSVTEFERGVQALENVLSCYVISGQYDYIMHIVIENLEAYEQFMREKIHRLPGITEIESSFAFGCVKPPPGSC